MNTDNKFRNWTKNIAMTSGGLCGLCCLLPMIGLAIGIGGLGAVAYYLEMISLGVLVASLLVLLFWQIRKRVKKSCSDGCSCAEHTACGVPGS
jgi:membrane protein implicated in regulation of membrane protease activity